MPPPPLRVGWKLSTLSGKMASVRYRALLPILALRQAQVQSTVFSTGLESNLDGLDALVVVKSFTADDIFLVQRARERGIRVLFDLCDNIFLPSYRAEKADLRPAQVLEAMAPSLDAVVVTTEPLAQAVRREFPAVDVVIIPDGIETSALVHEGSHLLQAAAAAEKSAWVRVYRRKVHNTLMRVREEGPSSIPPLVRHVYGRGMKVLRRKLGTVRHRMAGKKAAVPVSVSPESVPASRRILWFGNHGAPHARFGMLDLLEIRDALETACREFDAELVVVSNNREKYEQHIRPLNLRSRYVEWSPTVVDKFLATADVVVVPNSLDPFSLCKSANRTVLAAAAGVPVVATPTPALEVLVPWIHAGEPLQGLRKYLADRELGRRDAQEAFCVAQQAFGPQALLEHWMEALRRKPGSRPETVDSVRCAVVLNLIQDLDLALPVLLALRDEQVEAQAWCSASLVRKSPRVLAALRDHEIEFRVLPDDLTASGLYLPQSLVSVLTVAETNLSPHRFSRRITDAALTRGLEVATLQHGFENVGLTYSDDVHTIEKIDIAARRIYLWGDKSTLHPRASDSVRARAVAVGCPKPAVVPAASLEGKLTHPGPIVGVFENLHWHRYDDAYRAGFIDAVRLLAERFPQVCFLVKPHHAGMWLTGRFAGERPQAPNLVLADPASPVWENSTAPALLGRLAAVITTPSTVALDAARREMPCAVFADSLDLAQYRPLPLLRSSDDWMGFVQRALDNDETLREASKAFVARVIVPGDAARRIARELAGVTQR